MAARTKPKANGRPSKLTPKLRGKLLRLAEEGLSVEQLAIACDVAVQTVYNWQKDPEFQEQLKASRRLADHEVIASLYRRACGYSHPEDKIFQYEGEPVIVPTVKHYPPDTEAARFWLTNRLPEEWSNRQKTELSGNVVFEIVDYANADQNNPPANPV
jgi:transcriptional regulator with XRE-family HTH domain